MTLRSIVSFGAIALAGCGSLGTNAFEPCPVDKAGCGYDVRAHELILEVDPETGYVVGAQTITLDIDPGHVGPIVFSGNEMQITEIDANGPHPPIEAEDGVFRVDVRPGAETMRIELRYEGLPRRQYAVEDSAVYTGYFACDWMICAQDDFGDKASIRLELVLPEELRTLGPGALSSARFHEDGKWHAVWEQQRPQSAYLYAFALGDFDMAETTASDVTLRMLSNAATADELLTLFEPTADMLAFFESRAGTPFPHDVYSQLYVEGNAAQEAVSHAIIGTRLLAPILETPEEDWVIAHELAHQWWGNGATAVDLTHFWLNEGVTVFMVAAWKEHRWGRDAYEREMELLRQRFASAIDAGFDVPLSFAGEYPSLRVRRAIQYSKGALFMDALRTELGDEAFWAGLAAYTLKHMNRAVVSKDFQASFEAATGRDLSALFEEWVY